MSVPEGSAAAGGGDEERARARGGAGLQRAGRGHVPRQAR